MLCYVILFSWGMRSARWRADNIKSNSRFGKQRRPACSCDVIGCTVGINLWHSEASISRSVAWCERCARVRSIPVDVLPLVTSVTGLGLPAALRVYWTSLTCSRMLRQNWPSCVNKHQRPRHYCVQLLRRLLREVCSQDASFSTSAT